jgi:NTP pyrophosphatase (non-canonical NTP hydrolase)
MEIKDFQEMIGKIYIKRDRERGKEKTMLWVVEEVGELSQAVRKGDVAEIGEELADVFAWLVSLANLYNIDLENEIKKKYPGYCLRCGKAICDCETV